MTALQVGRQLFSKRRRVVKGEMLSVLFDKKVKGVDHGHRGDQLDINMQSGNLLREHQPRDMVAKRILLPIDEVLAAGNFQTVGINWRTAMRCRLQAYLVGTHLNGSVKFITGGMFQCYADGHWAQLPKSMARG